MIKEVDRQYNDQRKTDTKTNVNQQNTTQKTRYLATLTAIKTEGKNKIVIGSCSTTAYHRVTFKRQEHHLISKSYWTPVVSLRFLCERHLLIIV